MKNAHIYALLVVLCGAGIVIGSRLYLHHQKSSNTLAVCKIVFDTFNDDDLKSHGNGYRFATTELYSRLLLSLEKEGQLHVYDAVPGDGTIRDAWGGALCVVRYGDGIRVRSNGPDGVPDTDDDIEYR